MSGGVGEEARRAPPSESAREVGASEEVLISRLNWAGLGVAQPVDQQGRGAAGPDHCVPLSRVGERVQVRWREDARGRLFGERRSAPAGGWGALGCDQAPRCAGCTLRHLNDEERAHAQVQSHLEALERLCPGSTATTILYPVISGPRDGYRARLFARFDLEECRPEVGERRSAGMRARWGAPIDLTRCPVQTTGARALLTEVCEQAARLKWPPELEAVTVQAMGEAPSGLVVLHARHPDREALIESLDLAKLPIELLSRCGVYLSWLPPHAPRREPPSVSLLCGLPSLPWRCDEGLSWSLSLPAWLPQSPSTVSALRRLVWEGLGSAPGEQVFELGCGSGLLSLWLVTRGLSVRGADLDSEAIEAAQQAYRSLMKMKRLPLSLNSAPSPVPREQWGVLSATSQDGRRALASAVREGVKVDQLLVHAMRSPLTGLLPLAAHLKIKRVCYVAPSTPSLARDLAEEPRYQLSALRWLDQTPGTAQLLAIATLDLQA